MARLSWGRLSDMIDNSKKLDINKAFELSLGDKSIQVFIVDMNTDEQLFDEGIDSTGTSLESIGGEYAPSTIEVKIDSDLPFTHITLFQDGDFYSSFRVFVGKDSFTIDADSLKTGGVDLVDRWGEDIVGLTDENIGFLIKELIPAIVEYLATTLLS